MRFTTFALAATAVCLTLSSTAPAGEPATADPARNIVETAVEAGSFSTLVQAVKAAGLAEALQGEGPFTVFAPTDEAFAALPKGTVATLILPENRAQLRRVLSFHVVPGRVLSTDLLPVAAAKTLSGDALPLGLRVGAANVTSADIECSNGVIHVIDAVLLPPARAGKGADVKVEQALHQAIDTGVPLFNDGDVEGCARVYREATRRLVQGEHIGELHRMVLTDALTSPAEDATEEAWTLRRGFDSVLADVAFSPRVEAPLPEGFPGPGPVGRVVAKEYPRYRAARAEGGGAFWQLFEHIKKNDVAMTAPVEMTMDDDSRMSDMSFLYESPTQGDAGRQGAVAVLDRAPIKVLSIGMRGRRSDAAVALARKAIEARMAADGVRAAGSWRTLGYNSPMVPAEQRYWEVQVEID